MFRLSKVCMCAFLVLFAIVAPSFAAFPDGKPIRIVNPFAAGGAGDVELRMLAPLMEKHFGVPVVVENMTGAGGRIAYDKMYRETADGHTLFYNNQPALQLGEFLYDGRYKGNEFTYLVNVVKDARYLLVLKSAPYQTFQDLLEASKKEDISCAVSGLGSSGHLGSVQLVLAGLKHRIVPFDGTAPSKAAFLGGHVTFWIAGYSELKSLLADDKIKVLATLNDKRLAPYDFPTLSEMGLPEVAVYNMRGICAPPNLPEDIRTLLIEGISKAVNSEEIQKWAAETDRPMLFAAGADYFKLHEETSKMVTDALPMMKESIGKK